MSYVVKLKTGFFETTLCQFSITKDCINIIPCYDGSSDSMLFSGSELVSIHLTKGKHAEMEMKT